MKESPNFFIETNILVDYILLKEFIVDAERKKFPTYEKIKPSLDLIKTLQKKKTRWCTSFVNLCEMPMVLIKAIIMNKMYMDLIPFNYYQQYYSNFIRKKGFKKEIEEIIEDYYSTLSSDGWWFIHKLEMSTIDDLKEMDELRISFDLPIADALIFFIAKKEGGYFVTRDHHFLNNKKLKKCYDEKIKIISPKEAIEILG